MFKIACAVAASLVLIFGATAAADETADNLFSTDEEALFSVEDDALFGEGDDLLVEVDEDETATDLEEVFLVNQGIEAGGTYNFAINSDWEWSDGAGGPSEGKQSLRVDLGGTLYLDARPNRDFRVFAKARVNGDNDAEPVLKLHELFSDFDVNDRVFFRAGKQTVNWGVGYFFSPADIINIGRIDPKNPEAEREGPIALRANVPFGSNNLYAYAIASGEPGDRRLALAPKYEFVLGGSEVGLGLFVQSDRAPRAMATLSTSIGPLSVFGEAVLSKGSDKRFVEETTPSSSNPLGLEVVRNVDDFFGHATFGARYTYSDPDGRFSFSAAGQYYYNGEGYAGGLLRRGGVAQLIENGDLRASDVRDTGRHYGALSLTWTDALQSDFSPGLFWLGNGSDGSGTLSLSVAYDGWEHIRPSISVSRMYGEAGSEYAPFGPATRLTVGVTLGEGSF